MRLFEMRAWEGGRSLGEEEGRWGGMEAGR